MSEGYEGIRQHFRTAKITLDTGFYGKVCIEVYFPKSVEIAELTIENLIISPRVIFNGTEVNSASLLARLKPQILEQIKKSRRT